jgi:hypothetical protein
MSPVVTEVVEGLAKRIRSPLLVFVIVLNLGMLAFIYFGVSDRRAKDHELIQSLMTQCINLMERRS